ncbi:MAG: FMN-binding protein [Alphaproteobacteria bacterium]
MKHPIDNSRPWRQAGWLVRTLVRLGLALACLLPAHTLRAQDSLFQSAFPDATRFGPIEGTPPAAKVWRGTEPAGYIFHTRDVVATAGYSGKPIDVVVGLDLAGRLTGAVIAEHHEPILVIGVSDQNLQRFAAQFAGRDVREPITVTRSGRSGTLEAVSGATVSSIVLADGVLRAARAVARGRGLIPAGGLDVESFAPADWAALVADGSIVRRRVTVSDLRQAAGEQGVWTGSLQATARAAP